MVWLGLQFNTNDMTITTLEAKLAEIGNIVADWDRKEQAKIHELCTLLGKLFFVAQCCCPAKVFRNRILGTLMACLAVGAVTLSEEFQKDLNWFATYLPTSNGVSTIHQDDRVPILLYIDACTAEAGAIYSQEAYHMQFPIPVINASHPICHREALTSNRASKHQSQLIHL